MTKMIDSFLRLLDRLDSFKKVLIMALTIMTLLLGYFGYVAAKYADEAFLWNTSPQFVDSQLPCVLYRIKADFYLMGIIFPIPEDVKDKVHSFGTTYIVGMKPNKDEFNYLCTSIVKAINSNVAERLLTPYLDPDSNIPVLPR